MSKSAIDGSAPVKAGICVPFVTAREDFIRGTDVSSLLSVLRSGVRFKGWDGRSLGDSVEENGAGLMGLLHDSGVNWVRLRIWNDPYDANGHGYGGGNNDLDAAVLMGKWATDALMRVFIDFHYSDFWADPARQLTPKAWRGMDIDDKAVALEDFTQTCLDTLLDAGVDVGMVQVGNETTGGICGESEWADMARLFSAGCRAVRAVAKRRGHPMLTAIHFESPQNGHYGHLAELLEDHGVRYDVFASSYYPEWHGKLDNLREQLGVVVREHGVKVLVAETSAPWTDGDGDGDGGMRPDSGYPCTVQGQASFVADVASVVNGFGEAGLGFFYWESAWIAVRNISGFTGEDRERAYEENRRIWEEHGSGWATSFAGSYDALAAGGSHGGPGVDHKALFDFDGAPLESLKVFRYIRTGTITD